MSAEVRIAQVVMVTRVDRYESAYLVRDWRTFGRLRVGASLRVTLLPTR